MSLLSPNSLSGVHPVVQPGQPAHQIASAVAPAQDGSGNAALLNVDNSGNLKCSVSGAGSGGTSSVDEVAFTAGVSAGTPIMAEDPTSGELLIAQMSPGTRQLAVAASVTVTPTQSATASAVAQTSVGTSSGAILASNSSRMRCKVTNTGTTTLYLGFGKTPSITAYHIALRACGVHDDGSSPAYIDEMWTGAINAISSASGGTCVVEEDT